MSRHLIPCPSCNRHVFTDACACPFCAAKLSPESCAQAPEPPAGYRRLSRAARLAAGATLVGATACSVGVAEYGAPIFVDASVDAPLDAGAGGQGGSSGTGRGGAAGAEATGGAGGTSSPPDAGSDRGVVPLYGAAAPQPGEPDR